MKVAVDVKKMLWTVHVDFSWIRFRPSRKTRTNYTGSRSNIIKYICQYFQLLKKINIYEILIPDYNFNSFIYREKNIIEKSRYLDRIQNNRLKRIRMDPSFFNVGTGSRSYENTRTPSRNLAVQCSTDLIISGGKTICASSTNRLNKP